MNHSPFSKHVYTCYLRISSPISVRERDTERCWVQQEVSLFIRDSFGEPHQTATISALLATHVGGGGGCGLGVDVTPHY